MVNEKDLAQFRIDRVKKLKELYSDEPSASRRRDRKPSYSAVDYRSAAAVRKALSDAISERASIVESSKRLYATNPIYASVINYMADMFMWRYKVVPHKVYSKSKAKARKVISDEDFQMMYNAMLEAVDGLSIETKFPTMLTALFINGAIYFTTICDEDSMTVDTLVLPDKYCRKIGETQYNTAIISFDMSYFESLGLDEKSVNDYIKQFPKEFATGYRRYKSDSNNRWCQLDPHFSTGVLLNDVSIPTFFYLLGGILDYEKYQDNELERNENALKYLVVHTIPHYEDKLIFEVDEVAAIHQSLKKVVDTNNKARLITSYGDVHVEQIAAGETAENQVLSKAFKAIFNNAGFNSAIFTDDSVTAIEMSLIRDKGMVWRYVQQLLNFYTIAINNWFDFKNYEADIDILPISPYTYTDDMEVIKTSATLGVGKLDYLIASGIKQKNIQDQLQLESFLKLQDITPMQTSYTQSAEDRVADDIDNTNNDKTEDSTISSPKSEIEPSDSVEDK